MENDGVEYTNIFLIYLYIHTYIYILNFLAYIEIELERRKVDCIHSFSYFSFPLGFPIFLHFLLFFFFVFFKNKYLFSEN